MSHMQFTNSAGTELGTYRNNQENNKYKIFLKNMKHGFLEIA
jgi:hypothetical protein